MAEWWNRGRVPPCRPARGLARPGCTRLGAHWLHDACDQCRDCQTEWESYCPTHRAHGYTVNGCFAEYVIVQERYAAVIPEGLDAVVSAPLMCAGVTAYDGVMKAGLAPGKLAVILGCGSLGQYGIQIAKLTGATIVAVDLSPAKLAGAKRLGADECLLADDEAADKIKALGGADAVLNFAPSARIWPMVTACVNNHATVVSVAMVATTLGREQSRWSGNVAMSMRMVVVAMVM